MAVNDVARDALKAVRGEKKEEEDRIRELLKKTIHIDHVDVFTKKRYEGDLEFVVPSALDKVRIRQVKNNIIHGDGIDEAQQLAMMMAYIHVCCEESSIPTWLKLETIYDTAVIGKIFDAMMEHVAFFRKENEKSQ